MKKRRHRIIEQLRRMFPGKWVYKSGREEEDWDIGEHWFHAATGRWVTVRARLAPRWDGDDEGFVSEWRWNDGSLIYGLLRRGP